MYIPQVTLPSSALEVGKEKAVQLLFQAKNLKFCQYRLPLFFSLIKHKICDINTIGTTQEGRKL